MVGLNSACIKASPDFRGSQNLPWDFQVLIFESQGPVVQS